MKSFKNPLDRIAYALEEVHYGGASFSEGVDSDILPHARFESLKNDDPEGGRTLELWLEEFADGQDLEALDFFFAGWDALETVLVGASEEVIGYALEWLGEVWVAFDGDYDLAFERVLADIGMEGADAYGLVAGWIQFEGGLML